MTEGITASPGDGSLSGGAGVWYRAEPYAQKVTPVTVVRQTARTLTILVERWGSQTERRVNKDGFFATEAEAWGAVIARVRRATDSARRTYENRKSEEGNLRAKWPKHPEWNEPRATTPPNRAVEPTTTTEGGE